MNRKLMVGTMFVALLGIVPSLSAAPPRVFARPSFGYFAPSYGFGWYSPWYPSPYFYGSAPVVGEVKINTDDKDARVFVDGGYLGTVRHFKKFGLMPGNHDIELHDAHDNVLFKQRTAVTPGRTTELDAKRIGG